MSFNIRYGDLGNLTAEDRYDNIEAVIEKGRPDSIGLQEATPEWMDYLKANLDDYAYVGVGRDDGVNTGEYAAIFYLKDKYTAVDSGTFWLSPSSPKLATTFWALLWVTPTKAIIWKSRSPSIRRTDKSNTRRQ